MLESKAEAEDTAVQMREVIVGKRDTASDVETRMWRTMSSPIDKEMSSRSIRLERMRQNLAPESTQMLDTQISRLPLPVSCNAKL
jgi:hypothetical protein